MKRLLVILLLCCPVFAGPSFGAVFTVTTTADSHDAHPGDGICADRDDTASAHCSVRAAIEESSVLLHPDTIVVPPFPQPILLDLGPLIITGNGTLIQGEPGLSILDGLGNPYGSSIMEIRAENVTVRGLVFQRSHGDALLISGQHAVIGGESSADRNIFVLNGLDRADACAVRIAGDSAYGNLVLMNFIGMTGSGAERRANCNGIALSSGAHDNTIGRASSTWANLISGNSGYGVIITSGAHHNDILGNIIGADITGTVAAPNDSGGLLLTDHAHDNRIGNDIDSSGNLISGNGGPGLWLRGSRCTDNRISGNFIGLQLNGLLELGNRAEGILISDAAHDNLIGSLDGRLVNLISGNYGCGVRLRGMGTSRNIVAGNRVGPDIRGYGSQPNGIASGSAISIESGASDNVIGGGSSRRNTISGNYGCGIVLRDAGTSRNVVAGNFIGVSTTGVSSLGNSSGVLIWKGASGNIIGGAGASDGNVISANRGDLFPFGGGVMIYDTGTAYNIVAGNRIGTDSTGTRAIRNGSAGVIIGLGASHNTIGGLMPNEGNIISGNGSSPIIPSVGAGVHLFGSGSTGNRVVGNRIGLSATGIALPNTGNGVALVEGASDNEIGGDGDGAANSIAYNHGHGVYLADAGTVRNRVRRNSLFTNDSLGIAIRRDAQGGLGAPVITAIDSTSVSGVGAPPMGTVDLYVAAADPSGYGEGKTWLASGTAAVDGSFAIAAPLLHGADTITVQGTAPDGASSGFSSNVLVSHFTAITEPLGALPDRFALHPNYPNPFNATTQIAYDLPRAGQVELTIINLLGQQVARIASGRQSSGRYRYTWDGCDRDGRPVASGVYWYRLTYDGQTTTRKLLLLK